MEIKLNSQCPNCNSDISLSAEVTRSMISPNNLRCKMDPIGSLDVYRITSEDIKQFVTQKTRMYVPEASLEIIPSYTEKKRRHQNEQRKSYAFLKIAMTDNVLENKNEDNFYERIANIQEHLRFQPSVFANIINLYKYNPELVSKWAKDYKILEMLENKFGMNEKFISDIREFAVPKAVPDSTGRKWIIFAARAEAIIEDMVTDVSTNTVPGKMQIMDIIQISQDLVEFIVYLYPQAMNLSENTYVRQILTGENK